MPVRLVGGSVEKVVDLQGDKFVFIERPISKIAFNQDALDWIDKLAVNLQQGYVLVVDYGHSSDNFQRHVQVRAQHRHLDSPFDEIGHADITMHVDWKSIAQRAEANGLRVAGFTDQHHFLTGIISKLLKGRTSHLRAGDWGQSQLDSPKAKRTLQTLLHPEMLGRAFQVLALSKNIDPDAPRLAGFTFGREPSSELGIAQ
jgi:SAM-dependent MidA family methyltransferase